MTELWVEDPDLPGYWKRPPLICADCGGKLEYPIEDPQVVIDNVIQESPLRCVGCGHRFTLKVEAVNFLVRAGGEGETTPSAEGSIDRHVLTGKDLPKRGEAVTVIHAWYGSPCLLSGPVKFIDEHRIEVGRTSIPWKGYGCGVCVIFDWTGECLYYNPEVPVNYDDRSTPRRPSLKEDSEGCDSLPGGYLDL